MLVPPPVEPNTNTALIVDDLKSFSSIRLDFHIFSEKVSIECLEFCRHGYNKAANVCSFVD